MDDGTLDDAVSIRNKLFLFFIRCFKLVLGIILAFLAISALQTLN